MISGAASMPIDRESTIEASIARYSERWLNPNWLATTSKSERRGG